MDQQQNTINYGNKILNWQVPEYDKHERSKNWYIGAIIVALIFLWYSYYSSNFLFAAIVIISALVMVLHDGKDPDMVNIIMTTEGMIVGRKFYDYDEFKDFSVLYKPNYGVRKLYFEFKNSMRHRISIHLDNMDPLIVRKNLLRYLSEDLERVNEPLSEGLGRLFKL